MTKIIIGLDENGKYVGHIPRPHSRVRYAPSFRRCKKHLIQHGAVRFMPSVLSELKQYHSDLELGVYQMYLKWQAAKGYRPAAAVNKTWSDDRTIPMKR